MVRFENVNQNSARNFNRVTVGNITLYFSYETVVAFRTPQTGFVVSENVWSRTTGKHLNWISGKSDRIPHAEFERKLEIVLENINVILEVA